MRVILAVVVLGACGPGEYVVEPVTTDYGCQTLDQCPVMAGGELFARAIVYTDVGEIVNVKSVAVEPPEIAEVTIEGGYIAIRPAPLTAGTEPSPITGNYATLRITTATDYEFYQTFTVAPLATTSVTPDRSRIPFNAFPERKLPGERLAMFTGESLLLIAEHRTIDGSHLLGHTADAWTSEGVQLAELPENTYGWFDRELMRAVRASVIGTGSVSMGSSTLPLDIVPAGSTAQLEVLRAGMPVAGAPALTVSQDFGTNVSLLAYAADGRYIYGGPPYFPVTVTSSDPTVVALGDQQIDSDREVWLQGYRSGTATVTFQFDGQTIAVPVTVE